jgi:hypothetical protein
LQRREYHVSGPHAFWHIDGNHKLIKYGLVIHGGIDGFSRAVVFAKCSNNNRAATVLASFVHATTIYCLPSRIRVENIQIAKYMVDHRVANNGAKNTKPNR